MGIKIIATNRKAFHDFTIGESWEAGLVLTGTEVKSLRMGKANLSDGWVDIEAGEAFMLEVHISPYTHGNRENHEEKRSRKLLLNKREIAKMESAASERGFTIIPIKLYFKDRRAKVEIALAKAKKQHDKREAQKKRESNREIDRAMKRR
jgi:SsrA-binding protein